MKRKAVLKYLAYCQFLTAYLLGNISFGQGASSHDEQMSQIEIKQHDIKTVGIFVYDGVNDLDALGPRYVMKSMMGVDVLTIAPDTSMVQTVMGLQFKPNIAMSDVDSLDILIIPGGFRQTIEQSYNQELLDWIIKMDEKTTYTASVCTGGWILGKTGLLQGKRATGNWFRAEEILKENGAEFTGDRYTRDGKYWSSAGVSAGIDMSLAMLAELTGEEYTQAVMLDMEYDPKPPIEGGSVDKTDPKVLNWMTNMYQTMSQPVFEKMEKGQKE
ncbi:MAG: DJ-1/PfpI family protein [Bacteroidota bacterium]